MVDERDIKINSLEIMMEQNNADHKLLREMLVKIDEKIDLISSTKADKWVERTMIYGITAAGVVFIGLLVRWIVLIELK